MKTKQWVIVAVLLLGLGSFYIFDLGQYLQFDVLRERLGDIQAYRDSTPLGAALVYFVVYIAITAMSLPGAAIMTLAGGAIFGFWYGLLLVSFASSIVGSLSLRRLASNLMIALRSRIN